MKFLKGMAIGFIGFFLFISILVLVFFIDINYTVLNPDFMVREIEKLDITGMARDYVDKNSFSGDLPIAAALDTTLVQEKTWINQKIKSAVFTSFDFLKGKSDSLSFHFSLDEFRQNFSANLLNEVRNNPPPEYSKLPSDQQTLYLENLKQQVINTIPSTYDLEINQALVGSEGMQMLQQAKHTVRFFQIAFWIIICITIILFLLMILVQHNFRGVLLTSGIIFMIDGLVGGISFYTLKTIIPLTLLQIELPGQFTKWLETITGDLILPAGIISLIVFITGILCLTASFFIKNKTPEVI